MLNVQTRTPQYPLILQLSTVTTSLRTYHIATMRLSSLVIFERALLLITLLGPVLAQDLALKAYTLKGCYDSSEPLEDFGAHDFQSYGECQKRCVSLGKAVMGLAKGTNCWCGDLIPAKDSKVSDSKCDSPCEGYGTDMCTPEAVPRLSCRALTQSRWWIKGVDRVFDRNRQLRRACG